jgi:quinol monooxygenase YgiN
VPGPRISVIVKFTANPGQRDALVASFDPMFAKVAGEPGTELYSLHLDTDEAAMNAHSSSEQARAANAGIRQFSAAREIKVLTPVQAKGLVL